MQQPSSSSTAWVTILNTFLDVAELVQETVLRSQSDPEGALSGITWENSEVTDDLGDGAHGQGATDETVKKQRFGRRERQNHNRDVSLKEINFDAIDAQLLEGMLLHVEGKKFLRFLQGISLMSGARHRIFQARFVEDAPPEGRACSLGYLLDLGVDGNHRSFVVDAYVLPVYRGNTETLAKLMRSAFINICSVVCTKYRGKIIFWVPMSCVDSTREKLYPIFKNVGFHAPRGERCRELFGRVEGMGIDAKVLDYSGREWMVKGPHTPAELLLLSTNILPQRMSVGDLCRQRQERCATDRAVRSKRLRRSALGFGVCYEGKYATLLVQATNVDVAGVISGDALELLVEAHCKEEAAEVFKFRNPFEVRASVYLGFKTKDETRNLHNNELPVKSYPLGSYPLGYDLVEGPPKFHGSLMYPLEDASRSDVVEYRLWISCKFYEQDPGTEGDLVTYIFEDQLFASSHKR